MPRRAGASRKAERGSRLRSEHKPRTGRRKPRPPEKDGSRRTGASGGKRPPGNGREPPGPSPARTPLRPRRRCRPTPKPTRTTCVTFVNETTTSTKLIATWQKSKIPKTTADAIWRRFSSARCSAARCPSPRYQGNVQHAGSHDAPILGSARATSCRNTRRRAGKEATPRRSTASRSRCRKSRPRPATRRKTTSTWYTS